MSATWLQVGAVTSEWKWMVLCRSRCSRLRLEVQQLVGFMWDQANRSRNSSTAGSGRGGLRHADGNRAEGTVKPRGGHLKAPVPVTAILDSTRYGRWAVPPNESVLAPGKRGKQGGSGEQTDALFCLWSCRFHKQEDKWFLMCRNQNQTHRKQARKPNSSGFNNTRL